MIDIVKRQLAQSISTMTRVLRDETIHDAVVAAARLTADSMKSGHKLLVCGNGGSAADAQHLVAEFVVRLCTKRPGMKPGPTTARRNLAAPVRIVYALAVVGAETRRVTKNSITARGLATPDLSWLSASARADIPNRSCVFGIRRDCRSANTAESGLMPS